MKVLVHMYCPDDRYTDGVEIGTMHLDLGDLPLPQIGGNLAFYGEGEYVSFTVTGVIHGFDTRLNLRSLPLIALHVTADIHRQHDARLPEEVEADLQRFLADFPNVSELEPEFMG